MPDQTTADGQADLTDTSARLQAYYKSRGIAKPKIQVDKEEAIRKDSEAKAAAIEKHKKAQILSDDVKKKIEEIQQKVSRSKGDGTHADTSFANLKRASDPFALMNRSLDRHKSAGNRKVVNSGTTASLIGDADQDGAALTRGLARDLEDPETQAYLRQMYPDFDDFMESLKACNYKYECQHDATFAKKYRMPEDIVDPVGVYASAMANRDGHGYSDNSGSAANVKEHLKAVDRVLWLSANERTGVKAGTRFVSVGHDGLRLWNCTTREVVAGVAGAGNGVETRELQMYDASLSAAEDLLLTVGKFLERSSDLFMPIVIDL